MSFKGNSWAGPVCSGCVRRHARETWRGGPAAYGGGDGRVCRHGDRRPAHVEHPHRGGTDTHNIITYFWQIYWQTFISFLCIEYNSFQNWLIWICLLFRAFCKILNRARKSGVCFAWRYEIHGIIASFETVRAQPHFQSHVKSTGDFSLLQLTAIWIIYGS